MASPTPTTYTRQVGRLVMAYWAAKWTMAAADDFTNTVLIDLSALNDKHINTLSVVKATSIKTTGIRVALSLDATTDEEFYFHPKGADSKLSMDFTEGGLDGAVKQGAGGTGDVLLTTEDAADGDEVAIWVYARVS